MTRSIDNNASVSSTGLSRRLLSATAQYAGFSLGAILLALLCMGSYAAVHQGHAANPAVREWLLPLSLVLNVFAVLFAILAGYQLRRLAHSQHESEKRNAASWPGMLQH